MKRLFACCLLVSWLLAGCSFLHNEFEESASFYYPRKVYDYHGQTPVIASEVREVTGHLQELEYMMSLYLMGPLDKELGSPFPPGTRLVQVSQDDNGLTVELTDTGRALTDIRFSLACACLSKTCMELCGVESVTVVSGLRSLTTAQENLLLTD